ncbi:MAG: AbrB/MazE/SpoVT family DNA-binding domain-containing protein [Cyanobacteria bacterium P01_D01_bin.123]
MKTLLAKDGSIDIPAEIRARLGLQAGDELLVSIAGDEVRLRPVSRQKLSQFRGILPATRPYPGLKDLRRETARSLAELDAETST